MEKSKGVVKLGIYLCALLMMGAIAIASGLGSIMGAFSEVHPNTIVFYIISVPCLVVIPTTIIAGKLMETIAKKTLMIVGVLFWLVGGVAPFFMGHNLMAIVAMRAIFGVGIGMAQTLCAALVVENFDDPDERNKTMGNVAGFQMLGTIIFSLVSGQLAAVGWHVAFLVHLFAIASLVGAIVCLPYRKPEATSGSGEKAKFKPTNEMWIWCIGFFVLMIVGQTYANTASAIIMGRGFGGPVAAGYSLAIFALGGFVMGLMFGKVAAMFKNMTLSFGIVLTAVSYLTITFAPNLALSYVGAFIFGLGLSVCIPCILNGSAGSVEPTSAGMAVSIATCLQNVGMAVCPYVVMPIGLMLAGSIGGGQTFIVGSGGVEQGALLFSSIVLIVLAISFALINAKKK